MPYQISELTMIKATLAAAYFLVTLLSGMSACKLLAWKGKKRNFTLLQFAAGVILGTAMVNLMVISDLAFREMRLQYPMTFLVFCVGYAAAMMMDILLARAVSKRLQDPSNLKSLGVDIGGADTKTMAWRAFLNATSYNIIYAASMAITVQSLDKCTPLIGRGFIVFISLAGSAGVMLERLCSNYEIISDTDPGGLGDKAGAWVVGLLLGFIAAVLVHLSVHHLLVDGNKARSRKVVAVIIGVGVIALLKVLEI